MILLFTQSETPNGYNYDFNQQKNEISQIESANKFIFFDEIFNTLHILENEKVVSFAPNKFYTKYLEDSYHLRNEFTKCLRYSNVKMDYNHRLTINLEEVLGKAVDYDESYGLTTCFKERALQINIVRIYSPFELKIRFKWEIPYSLNFIGDFKETLNRVPVIIKHLNQLGYENVYQLKDLISSSSYNFITINLDNNAQSFNRDCTLFENLKKYHERLNDYENLKADDHHIKKLVTNTKVDKTKIIYHQGIKLILNKDTNSYRQKYKFGVLDNISQQLDSIFRYWKACPDYDGLIYKLEEVKLSKV